MNNKDLNKLLSITLSFIIVINIFMAFSFIVHNLNHKCTHTDDCPICEMIEFAENSIKNLGQTLFFVFIFVSFLIQNIVLFKNICIFVISRTLVSSKVRLDN